MISGLHREASAQTAVAPLSDSASLARADELYREGNEAYQSGNLQAALRAYTEAFALKPSFDIAGNLGHVELKLGKHRDAAEHLALSLRTFPPNGKAANRDKTIASLREATSHVASLTFTTSPTGAEISLNGRVVGTAPIAREVFIGPGEVSIVARLGTRSAKSVRTVVAGETTPIALTLVEDQSATTPPPALPPPTLPPPTGNEPAAPPLWPGVALAAVGGVGLGVGLGLYLAGSGSASDAEDLGASIGASGSDCEPPSGPRATDCATLSDDIDSSSGLLVGGGVAMGIGGAVAAGGLVYLIWAATAADSPAAAAVTPWLSPEMLGGAVQGSF